MHYCVVGLDSAMTDAEYADWKHHRNQFRGKIEYGKKAKKK